MKFNLKNKKILIVLFVFVLLLGILIYLLWFFNYIGHKKYTNEDFNIEPYMSSVDYDGDGVDDQTDILNSVYEYIATKPKYKSQYYAGGYPNDEYGVCTDVVAFGLLGAGYDLRELVNDDILENRDMYNVDPVDKNIDFRRVRNLKIFFKNTAVSLTTDIHDIAEWQAGDIVIFEKHIGIISDHRNRNGVPFIIHNANPYQKYYEEDILEHRSDIVGHYRVS